MSRVRCEQSGNQRIIHTTEGSLLLFVDLSSDFAQFVCSASSFVNSLTLTDFSLFRDIVHSSFRRRFHNSRNPWHNKLNENVAFIFQEHLRENFQRNGNHGYRYYLPHKRWCWLSLSFLKRTGEVVRIFLKWLKAIEKRNLWDSRRKDILEECFEAHGFRVRDSIAEKTMGWVAHVSKFYLSWMTLIFFSLIIEVYL
jgi:hypothetical protein